MLVCIATQTLQNNCNALRECRTSTVQGTVPPFDFAVDGVTSISADTHKYGMGARGTSVCLLRNHELRRHMFFAYSE